MLYQTGDGEKIEGRTSREVLRKLRALSRDREPTQSAFMEALAERALQTTQQVVRLDSETHFVADLVTAGLLKEIK